MSGVSARVCIFAVPTALFTLLLWYTWTKFMYELCDFLSVPHGSTSILLDFGAVIMLGGRQSGETIFRLFLSRFWMSICLSLHSNFCPSRPPVKTPFTLLPEFLRFWAWFSEKFTVCSWWFSLVHIFNSGNLYEVTTRWSAALPLLYKYENL